MALTGKPDPACRKLLGQWLKPLGDDCATMQAILVEARQLRPLDPVSWITKAVSARQGGGLEPRRNGFTLALRELDQTQDDPFGFPLLEGIPR